MYYISDLSLASILDLQDLRLTKSLETIARSQLARIQAQIHLSIHFLYPLLSRLLR